MLQFMLLLKQTKDATDRAISLELNGDLVKLGTIKDAIHRHDETKSIAWTATFSRQADLILTSASGVKTEPVTRGKNFKISAAITVEREAPTTQSLSYSLGQLEFSLTKKGADQSKFALSPDRATISGEGFAFIRNQGRAWQLPSPIKSYAFPDQARTYFQNAAFLADLESAYEAELDNMYYLGPLREYPKRDYLWARSRPSDVGKSGEYAIEAILAATAVDEKRNLRPKAKLRPFQEMIAYWLQHMGLIHSFRIVEIAEGSNRWQAKVVTREGASEVLLTDVGFGVSQVLPVITLLQYVPEGSTVILEQPEIHLHPLAQAGLADVIIQATKHRRVQVILESHSEHLLLRLQRRMAEEEVSPEDVKLYFCDAPRGVSTLTSLDVDLYGNIRNWPPKFMGDAFNEIATAELRRIERRTGIAAE